MGKKVDPNKKLGLTALRPNKFNKRWIRKFNKQIKKNNSYKKSKRQMKALLPKNKKHKNHSLMHLKLIFVVLVILFTR
jgi:hypothetical protein